MVLKPLFSIVLDLEIPSNICMHPMRSTKWKRSNLRVPNIVNQGLIKKLFNYRHSLLENMIEHCFSVLKV